MPDGVGGGEASADGSVLPRPTLAERLERTIVARIVVSLLVVVLVGAQVVAHIPEDVVADELRDDLRDPAVKLQRLATTEMQWGVFAPDPRRTSLKVEAEVHFADGTMTIWRVPQGAVIGANLRFYRWRKWLERVRSDEYRSLWRPTAAWIGSLYADGPSPVTSVTLARWFRENHIRGDQEPYQRYEYYTLDLASDLEAVP